jgi:hypothetical protein
LKSEGKIKAELRLIHIIENSYALIEIIDEKVDSQLNTFDRFVIYLLKK